MTPDIFTDMALAVTAWVFSEHLIHPGNVFGWWGRALEWLHQHRLGWLAKPMGFCSKCFAGQLAFWHYLWRCDKYLLDEHITYACGAVFFTVLIQLIYERNHA